MQSLLDKLQAIDVDARIAELEESINRNKHKGPDKVDKDVKALKALRALKEQGITPYEAFTRETVPIIPAQYRAPIQLPNNTFMVPDVNELMRNIGFMSTALKDIKDDLPPDELERSRASLYRSVEALQGLEVPEINRVIKKNYYATISGSPGPAKSGYFQTSLTKKRVDLSGRSVISPNPSLDMDQVEIPIDMGLTMYKPFVKQELFGRGFDSEKANKLIASKDRLAIDALQRAGEKRPVLINRAPSIDKGSVTAHWPIFVDKYNINIPNPLAQYQKGDFDGDSVLCCIRLRYICVQSIWWRLWRPITFGLSTMLNWLFHGMGFFDALSLLVCGRGDIFIGNTPHHRKPVEAKPNEWGGTNYKYTAYPGQMVMAMDKDTNAPVWDEILYVSKHTKIPEYLVTVNDEYAVRCSPRNSILIRDGEGYRKADLSKEYIIGASTPIYDSTANNVIDGTITHVVRTGKHRTMYDLTLRDNCVFLADNYLFVFDTMAVHVPVSQGAIQEAIGMMPSKHLYNDVGNKIRSFPDHSAAAGIYILSKTKEGRDRINACLPPEHAISAKVTKPAMVSLLTSIAKDDEAVASDSINKLIRLGNDHAYDIGLSYGISDLIPFAGLRNDIIKDISLEIRASKDKSPDALRKLYKKYSDKASSALSDYYEDKDDPIGDILVSKSRGSASQMRDVLFSPLAVNSSDVITKPIKHSYIEGLTPAEYFAASAGARLGVLGRAQGTAQPGALGKVIFSNANSLVVNKDRGESMNSIMLPLERPADLIDRYLAADIYDGDILLADKDSPITPRTVQIAIKHGIKELPVYTPLMSSSADGGIPAMSYGIIRGNKLPEVGFNIGAHAAAGIVSPLYTESMSSFHTGGSMQDRSMGYPRLKQVLELTKSISNKATLSSVDGVVSDIRKDSLGGHTITVNGVEHFAGPSNMVVVHTGTKVEKGDPLSDGPIDPRDISKHKGLPYAQAYMVDELVKNTPGGIKRRAAEVVVEAITRYGEIQDPGDSEFLPGDVRLASEIERRNKSIENKIKYQPLFKGVTTLPLEAQSWMAQLNFRNINKALSRALSEGATSDTHSYEPAPALAAATEFGEGENGKY